MSDMILRTATASCGITVALSSFLTIGVSASFAQADKWSDLPYIQLSKNMTPAVKALPYFGKIDWKLERIPFIAIRSRDSYGFKKRYTAVSNTSPEPMMSA